MPDNRLTHLFRQYIAKQISPEEREELFELMAMEEHEAQAQELFKEAWDVFQPSQSPFSKAESDILLDKILETGHQPTTTIRQLYPWKWVAAAAVILIGITAYFLVNHQQEKLSPIAQNNTHDVAPGGNKAMLLLADGSTITLDSAQNGVLAQQGGTKINKLDNGELAYEQENHQAAQLIYNRLITPRGGQYRLNLPDGSKVWLNAASSIRYPAAFGSRERMVEVTGEAYFEVAQIPAAPFIVKVNKVEIQVLGTHFNIMAYDNEPAIKTTLLEGAVKVVSGNEVASLKPGEEARLDNQGKLTVQQPANREEAIAWKNGMFSFRSADIKTLMRQVERWYDVEVVYEGNVTRRFNGTVPRNVNVTELLKILELTGGVHFKVEDKKIIVQP
jgi:ferric-dicitrate binding protein FerR (iron transport regulator)